MSNKKTSDKNVANEEYLETVKEFIDYAQEIIDDMEYERPVDVTIYQGNIEAIKYILAEREQDKKRIQELEEELKYKTDNTAKLIEVTNLYLNSIPKQKAKDVLQKNRNELFSTTYLSKEQYEPYKKQIDRINKIERELLEGEK